VVADPVPNLITRAALLNSGYDDKLIAERRRGGDLVVLRKGTYVDSNTAADLDAQHRHLLAACAALSRVGPLVAASHETGVLYHGGTVFAMPQHVCLTREGRCYADFPGVKIYDAGLPVEHLVANAELAVVTAARAGVDVARHRGLQAALVSLDSLVRIGACSVEELDDVVARCARWPGIRRARMAVAHVDGRAESALESVSRGAFILQGVPMPETQQEVMGDDGVVYRGDFYWRPAKLIGESDGRVKYRRGQLPDRELENVLWAEKQRQDALEGSGHRFVRWDWDLAVRRPDALARRVLAKLTPR
jgi:hypothetical protein